MKTKTTKLILKATLCSATIVALLAALFLTAHASANAKILSINAPVMVPVMDTMDKATVAAKEAAVAEAQRASAAADGQVALQPRANVTIQRSSQVRVPSVTCGANNVRVEATNSGNDADYATLGGPTGAFAAINAGTHTGIINIGICGDTSEAAIAGAASATLNASNGVSPNYTMITITPTGTRSVSGAATAGFPLIDLNGADAVTIDGLNAAGNSLTISNTTASGTAGTSTIRMINGASGNTVTNCAVLGSSTSAAATAGGNILISTSTGGANSGNIISNNNLGPAGAALPSKCFLSLGSASPNNNTANTITGNNVFDFFNPAATCAGISISTNNATVTISNNRIFQTAPRTFTTTTLRYNGILVSPGSAGSATITGNTIGFGAANGTGTTTISGLANTINGIQAPSTSTTIATSIQNNTISGFNQTTSTGGTTTSSGFIGINVGATAGFFDIGGTTGNTIGSLDGSSSIVINNTTVTTNTWAFLGIFNFSFHSGDVISNNNIGTITINNGGSGTGSGLRGIRLSGTSAQNVTISNNIIGGTAAGSITDNVVGTYNIYGIDNVSANLTCTGNLIRNITGNANAAGFISISGIIISTAPTGVSTISKNTIHSLTDNSTPNNGAIYALYGNFPATANVVEQNFVHSLSIISTNFAAQTAGIIGVAGSGTYKNNMVRLGIDASGAPILDGYVNYGMFDIAGTNNFYFNSVYVGGGGNASTSNTFAFVSNVVTNTRNYIDNIFWNARSNTGAGKNYAIAVGGTAPNPPGLTSNYNDLYATGTNGFVGLFNAVDKLTLADWQDATTGTGQDANSKSVDPLFVNPTGNAATVNLHLMAGSPMVAMGTPVTGITADFDKEIRNPCTPDIGADEVTLYGGPAIANVTIMKTADAASVNFGNQIGFKVKLTNTTANPALGLAVTDNLPAAPGVNWTIDATMTDPGWSVVGAPPNQSLVYTPTTLAGNAMTMAHVISATNVTTCGSTLNNTASFTITNGCPGSSSGMASASSMVTGGGGPTTIFNQGFESGLGAWTVASTYTGGTCPLNVIWTIQTNPYPVADVACNSSATETLNSGSGSNFIVTNSDRGGSGTPSLTGTSTLTSPSFSTVGYTSLSVGFKHYFRPFGTSSGTVQVSVDGGATFTPVQTYTTVQGAQAAFATAAINLDTYVGNANVQVRFVYASSWDYYWAVDDIVVAGNAPIQPCPTPLTVASAVSRLTHGAAGDFDVDLIAGATEPRNAAGGNYKMVITFSNTVVSGSAAVTSGTGSVSGAPTFAANMMTVNLTGVTDVQCLNVTLTGVMDNFSQTLPPTTVTLRVLVGDTNGSGGVSAADVSQTKAQSGNGTTGTNYRTDVNASGSISAADISLVKSKSGNSRPPCP